MTTTAELADFVHAVSFGDLPDEVIEATKKRLFDSVGIAIGALGEGPVEQVYATVDAVSTGGPATLWGYGDDASLPQAAMLNTTLTRYLDYMDSFLAPGETPHPSDNVGTLVACGEREGASGADLLAATAAVYEIQGELAWNAPVRDRGWDHVTHTVLTQAAGAAAMLGLDREATRSAIGIAGTAHNALRVTRTEGISAWKGIASANAARNATYSALLAAHGIAGPTNLFEGGKGWKQVIAGDFEVDLDSACPRVTDAMAKRYVAETYAQSAVEGIIELATEHDVDHEAVERIHLTTFEGAKLIIGGGEGDRHEVETKAQADHSLPYMLAAALIDREMTTAQYDPERITRADVQSLLRTVEVEADEALTERFEAGEMPAVIDVTLDDDTTYHVEKDAFAGHPTNPMDWEQLREKFDQLTAGRYDEPRRDEIEATVRDLESHAVADLVGLL
ncbi:MAG: MmgE/PrpD family protein [Halobacteriaceae archaeon]